MHTSALPPQENAGVGKPASGAYKSGSGPETGSSRANVSRFRLFFH
jgi:hypothetical protein